MHRHFANMCSRIKRFYQNAQNFTGNTNNGANFEYYDQIFFLALSRRTTYIKHQYWQHFQECHDRVNVTKRTENISTLRISDPVVRLGYSVSY